MNRKIANKIFGDAVYELLYITIHVKWFVIKTTIIRRCCKTVFIYIYIYMLKIAELDCCQIIILSIYIPSTHAYTHVLRLSLD